MAEIHEAFQVICERNGGRPLVLIGFDNCLMGSMKVASLLAPYAGYLVASAEIEPGPGWYYSWVGEAGTDYDGNGVVDAKDIGKVIVDYYAVDLYDPYAILEDVDEDAAGDADPKPKYETSKEVRAKEPERWPKIICAGNYAATLALVDLKEIGPAVTAFDELAGVMDRILQETIDGDPKARKLYCVIARDAESAKGWTLRSSWTCTASVWRSDSIWTS